MGIVDQAIEQERLAVLHGQNLLDSPSDDVLHSIVARAAEMLLAPSAGFSLVDKNRAWLKERVGIEYAEIDRCGCFCETTIGTDRPHIVENAPTDERYRLNPRVIGEPFIKFYAGVPVHAPTGHPIGALFILDTQPRALSGLQVSLLQGLAREIELHLKCRRLHDELLCVSEQRAMLSDAMIHDIGDTAVYLRWSADAARRESRDPGRLAARCRKASDRLHELASAVMRSGNPRSNGIPVRKSPVELHDWLDLLGRRVAALTRKHGLKLRFSNDLPHELVALDAGLLERIVFNLVNNSLDAKGPGSKVMLHGDRERRGPLTLHVADDGPGFPAAVRDHIFEPYFRWQANGSGRTGVGLTASRLAAEALGGSLSLLPRSDFGTEFVVTVPVDEGRH